MSGIGFEGFEDAGRYIKLRKYNAIRRAQLAKGWNVPISPSCDFP
jgi:hypothetical protein